MQDILLAKLLGQFIELRSTQLFQRLKSLTLDCIVFFFRKAIRKTEG